MLDRRYKTLDIEHHSSDIKHWGSDIRNQASDIRHQTLNKIWSLPDLSQRVDSAEYQDC